MQEWRHDWKLVDVGYLEDEKRKCKKCGAVQTLNQDYTWMRKSGKAYWWPKMSQKCSGEKGVIHEKK